MRKRFVKLLLFKVDTQYRLLYGFSSETEQSSYLWKAFPADKKGQKLIVKAILSPSEADNFSINLTGTEPIMLCERVTLKSPQLYKREQLLYSDPRILRQISVLRYEMEHPAHVSAQEMLDAMTYACGDRTGSSPGHVSDKTFYIAMNYRQKAAAANSEISEEISAKLLELERKKGRIEYYVGMLDSRKANVIRLCFFDGRTIEDAAEELNISAKTAQIAKKKAIEDLTDLFALTSNIN